MTRVSKVLGHTAVNIYKVVTGATSVEIKTYLVSNGATVLKSTVTVTGSNLTAWQSAGYTQQLIATLIPGTIVDGFYSMTITVTGGSYAGVDQDAGFGYTADATNKLYSRIMAIDPVAPTFSVSQAYHTAKMLLDEMNWLENYNVPQRSYQFDKRLVILKEILGYA